MANEKYRVHEVAKDFNLPTKTITEILTKYVAAPKNHMQVLTDHELSIIFDYLTAHNQVSGIQAIYADVAAEQPKTEQPKQDRPAAKTAPQNRPQNGQQARPQGTQRPQPQNNARHPRPKRNYGICSWSILYRDYHPVGGAYLPVGNTAHLASPQW